MKKIVLFLSITFMAGVAFANMYNSIVDTTSWISNVPASVVVFREYFHRVNPGTFFRIFSPINQALALAVLLLYWNISPRARLFFAIAFLLAVSGDVITFRYFYPRNDLLMKLPIEDNTDRLRIILREWRCMNWVRTAIILLGLTCSFSGLNKVYKKYQTKSA